MKTHIIISADNEVVIRSHPVEGTSTYPCDGDYQEALSAIGEAVLSTIKSGEKDVRLHLRARTDGAYERLEEVSAAPEMARGLEIGNGAVVLDYEPAGKESYRLLALWRGEFVVWSECFVVENRWVALSGRYHSSLQAALRTWDEKLGLSDERLVPNEG